MATDLTITDAVYNRILTAVGYPVVTSTDLGVSDDNIKQLMVLPALKEYYRYFPVLEREQYEVGTTFNIDFPDAYTFAALDARIVGRYGGVKTSNPLINELLIKRAGRAWGSMDNDYGIRAAEVMETVERQTFNQRGKIIKITTDYENSKITGFTNQVGYLSVTWAKYSNNWASVRFLREEDAIKLAQAYVKEFFGGLWEMDNASLPNELDGAELLAQAKDLKDEIYGKWNRYTKPVVIR
jgi:hypothetical protein